MSWLQKFFGRNKPPLLDWRGFTQRFAERAEAEFGVHTEIAWGADIEETTVVIFVHDEEKAQAYMGNHFRQYLRHPEDVDEIIARGLLVIAQMQATEEAPISAAQIMPVLKHMHWVEDIAGRMREDGKEPEDELIASPFAGDLMLTYMLDLGEIMRTVKRSDLGELNIGDDAALLATALANLRAYAREQMEVVSSESSSLCQIVLDTNYDASLLLLLEEMLASEVVTIVGDPVVAVPARELFLLCSAEDKQALAEMRDVVAQVSAQSPYLLSELLYVWRDGRLQLLDAV